MILRALPTKFKLEAASILQIRVGDEGDIGDSGVDVFAPSAERERHTFWHRMSWRVFLRGWTRTRLMWWIEAVFGCESAWCISSRVCEGAYKPKSHVRKLAYAACHQRDLYWSPLPWFELEAEMALEFAHDIKELKYNICLGKLYKKLFAGYPHSFGLAYCYLNRLFDRVPFSKYSWQCRLAVRVERRGQTDGKGFDFLVGVSNGFFDFV